MSTTLLTGRVDEQAKCYCLCGIGIPLRYFSLCALTLQTTAAVVLTRYSKVVITQDDEPYASTSLVVSTEALKFVLSLLFIYMFDVPHAISEAKAGELEGGGEPGASHNNKNDASSSFNMWKSLIYTQNMANPLETLKLCIPALLYTLQNNMIYVALSNLEATTFQVGYQSKVITTAVLSVLMLNRSLTWLKWVSLLVLTAGIICTQVKVTSGKDADRNAAAAAAHVNATVGLAAVLISAFCSAFAGVYFEKILKGTNPSVWMRNAQLAFFSFIISVVTFMVVEPQQVRFFQGYNRMVAYLILTQAAGGLIIAVVVKYADNILKGFATALSIVLCGMFSFIFMGFVPSTLFLAGSSLAIVATVLYSV